MRISGQKNTALSGVLPIKLLRRLSIKILIIMDRILSCHMNRLICMMGWRIECIHFQILIVTRIYHIMLGSCGDNDCIAIFDHVFISVDDAFSDPLLKSKKLVICGMDFHADFLEWFQGHEDELHIFPCVEHLAKECILEGSFLDILMKSLHMGKVKK